jgi:hypothetical protein
LKIVKQAGVFTMTNGIPTWNDTSIDNDLPISAKAISPVFAKVNAEELIMKLDALRKSK